MIPVLLVTERRIKLRGSTQTEKLMKCEKTAENPIKEAALSKQDGSVIVRVQHLDLVAREAYFHESCR